MMLSYPDPRSAHWQDSEVCKLRLQWVLGVLANLATGNFRPRCDLVTRDPDLSHRPLGASLPPWAAVVGHDLPPPV